jgi:hypothetical protein
LFLFCCSGAFGWPFPLPVMLDAGTDGADGGAAVVDVELE